MISSNSSAQAWLNSKLDESKLWFCSGTARSWARVAFQNGTLVQRVISALGIAIEISRFTIL